MKHDTNRPPAIPPVRGFSPGFAALGLEATLLATLDTLGYEEPTPIQREAIPKSKATRGTRRRAVRQRAQPINPPDPDGVATDNTDPDGAANATCRI